ncbi:MAG TPA: glycine reductase [Mogibacterium sp.]|nr:glycine reductase [Mogibacterium sp.]
MSEYAVIKGASYTLAYTPDMIIQDGATQVTERIVNPESEYLKKLPEHIRSYEDVLSYAPNQVYIGNMKPQDLDEIEFPWYDKKAPVNGRWGKCGEIMPQDEFYGLMQISDAFDLVELEAGFAASVKEKLAKHELFTEKHIAVLDKNAKFTEEALQAVVDDGGCGLYSDGKLVGAVKKAHDVDVNLSAHVMLENIANKATSVLSLLHLIKATGINPDEVDYVIDCGEEACGDMNQRGGGNFAKAAAEVAGFMNATGSDVRSFCAAPAHALLSAASLVKAGTFKNVVVTAGGCTAKLGMNGKSHVDKGLPILEDVLAGFSVLISENNGTDPIIRTDIVGKHNVGTGSSPQAVISSLVTDALDRAGLKITDVDKFAAEMQNPDITKPAGAGDVPEANYKMIGALGVKKGDLERKELPEFIVKHGMKGWAPTQGHIPSGAPYLGPCREMIVNGDISRAMIIGKGSLFLGRLTNLFDGVSFVIEANKGESTETSAVSEEEVRGMIANAMKDFAASLLAE